MPRLFFRLGGADHEWELGAFLLTIGRDADSSIIVDDKMAAPHHALIRYEQGDYYLDDLDSRNGTFLNGRRVSRAKLKHDDHIRVASCELRFVDVPAAPTPSISAPKRTETGISDAPASMLLDELIGSVRSHRQREQNERATKEAHARSEWEKFLQLVEPLRSKIGNSPSVRHFSIDRHTGDVMIRIQKSHAPQLITVARSHPDYPEHIFTGIWLLRTGEPDRCLPDAQTVLRELVNDLAFLLA